MFKLILLAVRQIIRDKQDGALPKEVQARLPVVCDEVTVRRYMVQLWLGGLLFRIGWDGLVQVKTRRGYRMPTLAERLCYEITGVWPFTG